MTYTLVHHTSNTHHAFWPVVGVKVDGSPRGTWSGNLAAYKPNKFLVELPGDVGYYSHQTLVLSPESGSGYPSPKRSQIH